MVVVIVVVVVVVVSSNSSRSTFVVVIFVVVLVLVLVEVIVDLEEAKQNYYPNYLILFTLCKSFVLVKETQKPRLNNQVFSYLIFSSSR